MLTAVAPLPACLSVALLQVLEVVSEVGGPEAVGMASEQVLMLLGERAQEVVAALAQHAPPPTMDDMRQHGAGGGGGAGRAEEGTIRAIW